MQNDRHAVVDGCKKSVRFRSNNSTAEKLCSVLASPHIVDAGKGENVSTFQFKEVWFLTSRGSLPFAKETCWYQTALLPEGFAKCRFVLNTALSVP
jgi:hypothetical protein